MYVQTWFLTIYAVILWHIVHL